MARKDPLKLRLNGEPAEGQELPRSKVGMKTRADWQIGLPTLSPKESDRMGTHIRENFKSPLYAAFAAA